MGQSPDRRPNRVAGGFRACLMVLVLPQRGRFDRRDAF
ncbi:hypothetical protein Mpop_3652 [Methylorubrum populi BJ001]|uniref:Uncharacterized protein n=1 Tax=Methylorubrum populi (strain ATCC BAA-705 / NCIMB 13946 / BJ001) TaxID=441620 RepID=B1Z7J8_METPB|nr:hypothetical protein Mpop_3652 [Methylorubrum populi BJ001]